MPDSALNPIRLYISEESTVIHESKHGKEKVSDALDWLAVITSCGANYAN